MPVVDASRNSRGLPPGPARSFADPRLALPRLGRRSSTTTEVATLSDFDLVYRGGGRYGSRFDTLDGLDVSRVCASAGVAARAWWALLGGRGTPTANCTLVNELLSCLLPPATNSTRRAAAKEAAAEAMEEPDDNSGGVDDEEEKAAEASYQAACPLASELHLGRNDLLTRYTGVFLSSPSRTIVSESVRFIEAVLTRTLNRTCEAATSASTNSPCAPSIIRHDSYSPAIEKDASTGLWRVDDGLLALGEPLWAESNWPEQMYARIYPHGAPKVGESILLLCVGVGSGLLTYAGVLLSRKSYSSMAYKRL